MLGKDRNRVKGIIFNKFRGDIRLFKSAVEWTENYTGIKVVGVIPFEKSINLESEDSLSDKKNISARSDNSDKNNIYNSIANLLRENLEINFITCFFK